MLLIVIFRYLKSFTGKSYVFFFQDLYLSILMNLNAIIIDLEGKNNFGRNECLDTQHVLLYMHTFPSFPFAMFSSPCTSLVLRSFRQKN